MKEIKQSIRRDHGLRQTLVKTPDKNVILLDVTGDGKTDIAILDLTCDGNGDTIAIDTNGCGYFDIMLADTDGNDIPDTVLRGNLRLGIIDEAIRGPEVEAETIAITDAVISAVMEAAFTEIAAETITTAVYAELEDAARTVKKAYKDELRRSGQRSLETLSL